MSYDDGKKAGKYWWYNPTPPTNPSSRAEFDMGYQAGRIEYWRDMFTIPKTPTRQENYISRWKPEDVKIPEPFFYDSRPSFKPEPPEYYEYTTCHLEDKNLVPPLDFSYHESALKRSKAYYNRLNAY